MQGAIEFSLTSTQEAVEGQAKFECPGSRCTFNTSKSLAVCSRCEDLSSRLERRQDGIGYQLSEYRWDQSLAQMSPNSTMYRLPNGLFLDNIDEDYGISGDMVHMATLGTSNPGQTVAMGDIDTLIWSQTMIRASGQEVNMWPDYDIQATECALYYCVQNYSISVENGTVSQELDVTEGVRRNMDSWLPTGSNPSNEDISEELVASLAYHPADSLIPRSDLQLVAESGEHWNVSKEAVDGISFFMQHLFAVCLDQTSIREGNCTDAIEDWGTPNGFYLTVASTDGAREEYQPNIAKVLFETKDYAGIFDRMAISMSNAMRAGNETDVGIVFHPTTIYNVDWRWISLPLFVEIGGLIFFALAIWSTARTRGAVPVWKSSELAVLSHSAAAHEHLKEARTPQEHEKKAKDVTVLLSKGYVDLGDYHQLRTAT
jgi:hypothetical protein